MTCKDCIHYDVCEYSDNLEYADEECLKRDCPSFQNKADFVKVARCKDCKYWQDNNGGYPHEECRWGKEETPDADDFCSYGERKEK